METILSLQIMGPVPILLLSPFYYYILLLQTIIYTAKGGLVEKWGQAPFYWKFLRGTKPEVFTLLRSGSIHFALTSLRFFLTGNSAADRKRPIQKEGGLNEKL